MGNQQDMAAQSKPCGDAKSAAIEFTLPVTLAGHWSTAEGLEIAREYATKARTDLAMGDKIDLGLANAIYLIDRNSLDLLALQTAAKERIRWLSVQLALAQAEVARLSNAPERSEEARPLGAEAKPEHREGPKSDPIALAHPEARSTGSAT